MPAPIDEKIILDAALSVWREEGFRNATTRKVAARAGVGEVTLFRRFGDKAALFGAALTTEADRFQAAGAGYSGNLKADLLRVVEAYGALLERNGAIVLDFLLEAPRNDQLRAIAPVPMAAIASVAAMLARYQEAGALKPGNPFELVLSLLGPVIMGHAISKAQPAIQADFTPSAYVEMWLTGRGAE